MEQWMTPVGTVTAEVDLRVGGWFRVVMRSEGTVIEHAGEYREIEAPKRLVFTWSSPYTGPTPSLITIVLELDGENGTHIHLVHAELPEEVAESHRGGWGSMLARLALAIPAHESV
jgi:uncharacterized protein YndB with AHSA1/START domain